MKTTKLILGTLALLIGVASFTSCNDAPMGGSETILKLDPASPTSINFTATPAAAQTLNVIANVPFTATSVSPWLTVTKSDNTVTITATANPSTMIRNAIVVIASTSTTNEISVQVSQEGSTSSIILAPEALTFTATPDATKEFTVTTNEASWTVANSTESWVSWVVSGNKIIVTALPNTTLAEREVTLTVTGASSAIKTATITQEAGVGTITVTPANLIYTAIPAATQDITVTTNEATWTAAVEAGKDWVTFTKTGTKITVTVETNTTIVDRTANITFTAGGEEAIATVTQGKADVTLSTDVTTLAFIATSAPTKEITVTTNDTEYTVASNQTWATFTKVDGVVTVTAADNATPATRTATITITAGTGAAMLTKTIEVTQVGVAVTLSSDPTTLSFLAVPAGTQTLAITTNDTGLAWSVLPADNWISATITGSTVTVTVTEHIVTLARSGKLTLTTTNGGSLEVTINQAAAIPTVTANPSSLTPRAVQAPNATINYVVGLVSDMIATVESDQVWAVPTDNGDGTITVTFTDNTGALRTATITITTLNGATTNVSVSQNALVALTTPTTIAATVDAQTAVAVAITTPAGNTWGATITSASPWLTLGSATGSGPGDFTYTMEANTGAERNATIKVVGPDSAEVTIIVTQAGV